MPETVYFFGAGVSQEVGVPTGKELWEKMVDRWQRTGDQKIKEVLECAAYLNFGQKPEEVRIDLAQFLTLIDVALEQDVSLGDWDGEELRRIRHLAVYTLCQVLQASVQEGDVEKFSPFCQNLSREDGVISLNYDTVIDRMIKRFTGDLSYGFPINTIDGAVSADQGQLLLKSHGSLNWLFCSRCNQIFLVPWQSGGDGCQNYQCIFDGHPLKEVLITPTYNKKFLVPQLHRVWEHCFNRIKSARRLIFVGYSFPPGDFHLIYLLKRAVLAGRERPEIHIVATDAEGLVEEECSRIFARFKFHNTTFNEFFRRVK